MNDKVDENVECGASVSTECESYTCSESSDLQYDVLDYSPDVLRDVSVVVEQGRLFYVSEEFMSIFVASKIIMSGDLVLSFCGFAPLEKICSTSKKLGKVLSSLARGVSRDDVYVFCTERVRNVPLEMVFDMYRKIEFQEFKYIVFISRLYQCTKIEMKNAMEDFREYDPSDLRHMPTRGEEVLLLSQYVSKKQITVNNNNFRLFMLRNEMFASFIDMLAKEL